MKVLVVDDSEWVHSVLRIFALGQNNLQIVSAHDGFDAVKQLRGGGKPDAIVVDYNMPGMTGLDFIREIRRMPEALGVPVIVSTTEPLLGPVLECVRLGAQYLQKPYTAEKFRAKLDLVV